LEIKTLSEMRIQFIYSTHAVIARLLQRDPRDYPKPIVIALSDG
jgi:hypothetical protein